MFCIFPTAKNVYAFQVFTPEFCEEFIEEINHFENTELPKGRPNTMNNYGVCRSVLTISVINMLVLRFRKSEPRRRQCLFDKKQHSCISVEVSQNIEEKAYPILHPPSSSFTGEITVQRKSFLQLAIRAS